ncbi:MAG TPA: HNH endonuclease signature motif containing protein, partial [Candidatus Polarisedimenticolia bacterium]|nr:HNH endonuclease signature motif containing protein [Candidatus Polarisedimenticolia bacterium]
QATPSSAGASFPPPRSDTPGTETPEADLAYRARLLDRHLRRLSRRRNTVEWRVARLLERLGHGSGYLDLGFARLSDYARERLGLTARRVQTLLGLARRLGPLPRVAAAYESGVLSQSQAALVARVAVASDQERWILRAKSLTVRRLTQEVLEALTQQEGGVRAEVGGFPDDGAIAMACDEEDAGETVAWSGPARLRPLWDEALELARRSGGVDEPTHGCVEFIAADFLAGAPDGPRVPAACPVEGKQGGLDAAQPDGTDLFEAILDAIEPKTPRGADADRLEASLPDAVIEGLNDTPRLIDLRLRRLVALRQNLAWHQGRLLRVMAARRLYRHLGFLSFSRYCQERAGVGARRAWQLIALDRRLVSLPRLAAAYRTGELSWVRASAIAGLATEATEADWIRVARSVTVRRLRAEVGLAMAVQGGRPPGLASDGRVQLSAPRAAGAGAETANSGGQHRVQIRFWAPLEVASLWRQAVAASRMVLLRERGAAEAGPAEWECVELILKAFVAAWSVRKTAAWQRRYRIFERDGWRCRVPGCSSRANLQVHHVVFRSQGGGEDDGNLVTLCAAHHLRGIHQGRLRCHALPDGLLAWEFAPDPFDGPLVRYVEDVHWEAAQGAEP